MIPHQYVTLETARLLKDAGFPQYEENGIGEGLSYDHGKLGNYIRTGYDVDEVLAAPTQAQAMRWLRDDEWIGVEVLESKIGRSNFWDCGIYDRAGMGTIQHFSKEHPTYEDAAETAIQAACKYIIQIRENK